MRFPPPPARPEGRPRRGTRAAGRHRLGPAQRPRARGRSRTARACSRSRRIRPRGSEASAPGGSRRCDAGNRAAASGHPARRILPVLPDAGPTDLGASFFRSLSHGCSKILKVHFLDFKTLRRMRRRRYSRAPNIESRRRPPAGARENGCREARPRVGRCRPGCRREPRDIAARLAGQMQVRCNEDHARRPAHLSQWPNRLVSRRADKVDAEARCRVLARSSRRSRRRPDRRCFANWWIRRRRRGGTVTIARRHRSNRCLSGPASGPRRVRGRLPEVLLTAARQAGAAAADPARPREPARRFANVCAAARFRTRQRSELSRCDPRTNGATFPKSSTTARAISGELLAVSQGVGSSKRAAATSSALSPSGKRERR